MSQKLPRDTGRTIFAARHLDASRGPGRLYPECGVFVDSTRDSKAESRIWS